MKAQLAVAMDNAAFEENPLELSRILRSIADKIDQSGGVNIGDSFQARDINGNKVGELTVM